MLNYINQLPSFNQVSAGKTSSLTAVSGRGAPTYRSITLLHTAGAGVPANEATMKANIETVKLKINGTTRFEVSGKYIIDILMKYYGIAFKDGQITIPLSRPWMRTIQGEDNLGWGMKNVRSFEISVKLASGATSPTLEANAEVLAQENDLGVITQVHEFIDSAAASGKYENFKLPTGNGDLMAMHFDNANFTELDVRLNKIPFRDCDIDGAHEHYKFVGERSPQTGYQHVDALLHNRLADVWPIRKVGEFHVLGNISAAGTIPIIMETLNAPLNPEMLD